ncbi:MAG: hypothetical protein ABL963_15725 [Longimicrobiales bacterium]
MSRVPSAPTSQSTANPTAPPMSASSQPSPPGRNASPIPSTDPPIENSSGMM